MSIGKVLLSLEVDHRRFKARSSRFGQCCIYLIDAKIEYTYSSRSLLLCLGRYDLCTVVSITGIVTQSVSITYSQRPLHFAEGSVVKS